MIIMIIQSGNVYDDFNDDDDVNADAAADGDNDDGGDGDHDDDYVGDHDDDDIGNFNEDDGGDDGNISIIVITT